MINENSETKEYARELRLAAKREEQNTAPSARRPADPFDDLFVEDYSYWRTNGHDRNEALRLARSARSDRECEGEKAAAEKAKEQKAKQSARPALPRLPATSEVDEAEFLAAWDDVGPEKWQAVLPSLTFEQIRDGFLDREKVMRKMWNAAAKEFANPLVGIREFLIFHDTIIERDRLIARELRVQLEKRVAALEERGVGLRFVGTYRDENVYNHGDVVSHGGSAWHTNLPTCGNKPGEGEHFTLMVKRGRDARDRK